MTTDELAAFHRVARHCHGDDGFRSLMISRKPVTRLKSGAGHASDVRDDADASRRGYQPLLTTPQSQPGVPGRSRRQDARHKAEATSPRQHAAKAAAP